MHRQRLASTLLVVFSSSFLFLGSSTLPAMARPESARASLAREWPRPPERRPSSLGPVDPRTLPSSIGRDAPRVSGDEHWADTFNLSGVTGRFRTYPFTALSATVRGSVNALASDGHVLYVAGDFDQVAGVSANNIAKWDGSTWSPLASGTDDSINALAVDSSGNLYAGGGFRTAGGVPVNAIAKWNGSAWSALGSGVRGDYGLPCLCIKALAVDSSGNLYAGGSFAWAGEVRVRYIAKWNGANWADLATGTDGTVNALAVDPVGNLYASGLFMTAGSVVANGIAKWNGSTWSALGSGGEGGGALVVDNSGNLYAGGPSGVAKWNGSSWSALGMGALLLDLESVTSLALDRGGNLVAGTAYSYGVTSTAGKVARWNGSGWSVLGEVTRGAGVYALALGPGGELYVGGDFAFAGTAVTNSIARWDGSTWSQVGKVSNSVEPAVNALLTSGGTVYVGGDFFAAGTAKANAIALWNGASWSALGSGMSGGLEFESPSPTHVNALVQDTAGHLYAGGSFTTAGGVTADGIARWDGAGWSPLSSGMDARVNALAFDSGGNLYAGGMFYTAGGATVNGIAKWNGSTWSALGSGMNPDSSGACWPLPGIGSTPCVLALVIDPGGNVYAAGSFVSAGGVSANNIARWNGASWSPLSSGTNGAVYALALDGGGNLYAGGSFTTAGGVTANGVAEWNGSTWSALGAGVGACIPPDTSSNCVPTVEAIAKSGSDLSVGGNFTMAGSIPAHYVAKWNGAEWSALGSGTDGTVKALAVSGTDLYVGGRFSLAGGKPSMNFALWSPLPTVLSFSIPVDKNQARTFSPWDFAAHFSDLDGDSLNRVKITSLPAQGTLKLGATPVVLNQEIAFYDLVNLTYMPPTDWLGTTSFSWTGRDGTDYAASSATTTLIVAEWKHNFLPWVGH